VAEVFSNNESGSTTRIIVAQLPRASDPRASFSQGVRNHEASSTVKISSFGVSRFGAKDYVGVRVLSENCNDCPPAHCQPIALRDKFRHLAEGRLRSLALRLGRHRREHFVRPRPLGGRILQRAVLYGAREELVLRWTAFRTEERLDD
jgi:hypothetical protein